jgi:hypothetical protein
VHLKVNIQHACVFLGFFVGCSELLAARSRVSLILSVVVACAFTLAVFFALFEPRLFVAGMIYVARLFVMSVSTAFWIQSKAPILDR